MDFNPHIILEADGYNHLAGTVSLKRADAARLKVAALDFNVYPAQAVGSARSIGLRAGMLYYLIEAPVAAKKGR